MHKIIGITGSNGTIGVVLKKGLTQYNIKSIDLPKVDVTNYEQLLAALANFDIVIHLAWNSKIENFRDNNRSPDNSQMAYNIYKASKEAGVKRVVMASSIHADSFYGWETPPLLSVEHPPIPDSVYGAEKLGIEALGKFYAKQGLEVVMLRIGGINPKNVPPIPGDHPEERKAWLSHNDIVSLVRLIINANEIPNNYTTMYVVSNNEGKIHDTSNIFNWKPKDNADDFNT